MQDPELIDVKRRMAEFSVEELCETAELYFRSVDDPGALLAKPLARVGEAPELLQCFSHLVSGLDLLPEMTVLDFGAGGCWTSRFLTQLGMRVIAADVSETALRFGEELYRRHPPFGAAPPARFLRFDGRRLDLPDGSVDRITCWEAFHHVPNQAEALAEMARVLKPGGLAGFSEPGPTHSRAPQSQAEMRNYRVIENDVVVSEIWELAEAAGFTKIQVAVYSPAPVLCDLNEFEAFVEGRGKAVAEELVDNARAYLRGRRMFFLSKGESQEAPDSRRQEGLAADLTVTLESSRVQAGASLRARAVAKNTGAAVWLAKHAAVGGVHLGVHLYDTAGALLTHGYHVQHGLCPSEPGKLVRPGEEAELAFEFPAPAAGSYVLEFDLVSSGVAWFSSCGTKPVRIPVEIAAA